jgi:hypothetical protein
MSWSLKTGWDALDMKWKEGANVLGAIARSAPSYGMLFVRASREAAEVLSDVVGLVAISDIGARDTLLALVHALHGHLTEIRAPPGSLRYPRRRWRRVCRRKYQQLKDRS